jgi:hypothetical protein
MGFIMSNFLIKLISYIIYVMKDVKSKTYLYKGIQVNPPISGVQS